MFDFLVANESGGVPILIYDSACNDSPIQQVSASLNGTPQYDTPALLMQLGSTGSGWLYSELPDPLNNTLNLTIKRSGGRSINPRNFWLSEGKLHFVDYNATAQYLVTYLYPSRYPDLIVSSITHTQLAEGGNTTITAIVQNIGNASAILDTVNVSVNISGFLDSQLVNLTSLAERSLNFTWPAVQGRHNITVIIDPANEISEENETNNRLDRTILLLHENTPPLLQPIANVTVNESGLVVITANASDPDNDALSYSINESRFTQLNNTFSWLTQPGDAGVYGVTVSVSDGQSNITQEAAIIVLAQAVACYAGADCGTSGFVGGLYCANGSVYRDYLSYSCLDPGLLNSTCINTTAPVLNESCSHSCSNGTCVPNNPPVLQAIPNITVNESDLVAITANASDPDNDALSYSINDSRFAQANDTFSWLTQSGDAGVYVVRVTVSDGVLNASQEVIISVLAPSIACYINTDCGAGGSIGDLYCLNGSVYQDYMSYTCLNAGSSNSTCINTTTPTLNESCTKSCSNGTCTQNNPPVLQPISNITVNESDLVVITATASDPDNDTIAYSINDSRFTQVNNTFSWLTQSGDAGAYEVAVVVSDGELNASQQVVITVLPPSVTCYANTDCGTDGFV